MKQDRAAPRTVADIERKYNFGKSFAEIMGIVEDTRNEVDSAYSELKDEITEQSTSLRRDTEQIVAEATKATNDSISALTNTVETKMSAEQVSIAIKETLDSGVDKVEIKETGYVFDSEGLKINKTGSGISNLLDNTGMFVKRDGVEILTADSNGVVARDLHAKTYLKIGSGDGRCRFEDYGTSRIGCFWTGG